MQIAVVDDDAIYFECWKMGIANLEMEISCEYFATFSACLESKMNFDLIVLDRVLFEEGEEVDLFFDNYIQKFVEQFDSTFVLATLGSVSRDDSKYFRHVLREKVPKSFEKFFLDIKSIKKNK